MSAAFTSPPVQELRRLLARRRDRHEARRFVVEGPVLVGEAVAAGWTVVSQFAPADQLDRCVPGAGQVIEVAPDVLGRLGSTQAPQAPIAIVEMPDADRRPWSDAHTVVVLDRIADPGNLGTILRSAEAAGIGAVVLTPGSVDPYGPKVVRASAGALFHVPIAVAELADVADAGFALVGTSSHDRADRAVELHTEADLTGRLAVVMGNEAAGLPDEWTSEAGPIRRWITVPHRGRSESLNVAMATTVIVFEIARQRTP